MSTYQLSKEDIKKYHEDGYLIVRHFFSTDETQKLFSVATEDGALASNAFDLNDTAGKRTKLTLRYVPGNDVFGKLVRTRRMINAVKNLIGDNSPICHFHSKLMQKESRVGGAWEWHQDYGYWYKNGFLFPENLISVMVALTEANIANGCLQVIRGSHKMGRVEHNFAGEQQGANMEFVNEALKKLELVYVELQPGDTLFFHSNILHRSEANNSDQARWSFISCYNLEKNVPFYPETHKSSYTPLNAEDEAEFENALAAGREVTFGAADFWNKEKDLAHKK